MFGQQLEHKLSEVSLAMARLPEETTEDKGQQNTRLAIERTDQKLTLLSNLNTKDSTKEKSRQNTYQGQFLTLNDEDLGEILPYESPVKIKEDFISKDLDQNTKDSTMTDEPLENKDNFVASVADQLRAYLSQKYNPEIVSQLEKGNFPCEFCDFIYVDESSLRDHEKIHTQELPFECKICSERFKAMLHVKRHILIHTAEMPFKCKHCDSRFENSRKLKKHKKIHDEILKNEDQKMASKPKINQLNSMKFKPTKLKEELFHSCFICSKKFQTLPHLNEHMNVHISFTHYICQVCGEKFRSLKKLKEHQSAHPKTYCCSMCPSKFISSEQLLEHKLSHKNIAFSLDNKCKICCKVLKSSKKFYQHLQEHAQEKKMEENRIPMTAVITNNPVQREKA